jgi:hypothetical protein
MNPSPIRVLHRARLARSAFKRYDEETDLEQLRHPRPRPSTHLTLLPTGPLLPPLSGLLQHLPRSCLVRTPPPHLRPSCRRQIIQRFLLCPGPSAERTSPFNESHASLTLIHFAALENSLGLILLLIH